MKHDLITKIAAVTIFQRQARVLRQGEIAVEKGEHDLLVLDLPARIREESLRVRGRGECLTIKDFSLRQEFLADYQEDAIKTAREGLEQKEKDVASREDEKARLATAQNSITTLSGEGMLSFARSLAFNKAEIADLMALRAYLNEAQGELQARDRQIDQELIGLRREMEALQRKLDALISSREKKRLTAVIRVEASAETTATLMLEYIIQEASWLPQYELRLKGDSLHLSYSALITQYSGEDWEGIDLKLSTASPVAINAIPELRPWFINLYTELPVMAKMASADFSMREAAPAPYADAEVAGAAVEDAGLALNYLISYPVDVKSDRMPVKVGIGEANLKPEMTYLSFPSLGDQVFVSVKAVNDSPFTLLPGQAALFSEGDYAGKTRLPLIVSGETLEVLMGVEDRIRVERERTKRDVMKSRVGTARKEAQAYQIRVINHRPEAVQVEIQDQIPLSQHPEIKVELVSSTPQPEEFTDLHIIKWLLPLAASEERTITYTFTVESPKDRDVVGIH